MLSVILFAPLFTGCDKRKVETHTFTYDEGILLLDSTRFTVGSVELSYARVPRGYWGHRMQQARAMGANAIMVRVPWMLHEEQEGLFDFTGEKDVREFCRMAQANGLFVWLHVGPFVDACMDFGGMPWWLLKEGNMPLRSHHKAFMNKVGRYYRALSQQLADMQITKGGPIILINIEEPMVQQYKQREYLSALADTLRVAGFDGTLLTTTVKRERLLSVPEGVLAAIGIDEEHNSNNHFSGIRKRDPEAPVICAGTESSCDHIWGKERVLHNYNKRFMRSFEVFNSDGSMNIGFAFGGTSFGHLAGAVLADSLFLPYATSYDNSSIISEGGIIGKEAERFAQLYKNRATQLHPVVYSPEYMSLIMPKGVAFSGYSPLYANLAAPLLSGQPLTLEQCNVGYGGVLYETVLKGVTPGVRLRLEGVRDNAQVILGGKLIASVKRSDRVEDIRLDEAADGDTLRILVDAYGRVADIRDCKGLVGGVSLVDNMGNERLLDGWKNYPFPSSCPTGAVDFVSPQQQLAAGYYRATFKCSEKGDFYIFTGAWGRGEAWINGHSLGRYSSDGPQRTLYVPGCWLCDNGENELVILDWTGLDGLDVECFKNAIL